MAAPPSRRSVRRRRSFPIACTDFSAPIVSPQGIMTGRELKMAQAGIQNSSANSGDPIHQAITFTNAKLFDGTAEALHAGLTVTTKGGVITDIRSGPPQPDPSAVNIDCGGRTLMPGLIDAHWHTMLSAVSVRELMTADMGDITLRAAAEARQTLLRGFTSVRDMAGPCFSLKRAIDSGIVDGPRIWPSGAIISQSGGHGDFRCACELPALTGAPG